MTEPLALALVLAAAWVLLRPLHERTQQLAPLALGLLILGTGAGVGVLGDTRAAGAFLLASAALVARRRGWPASALLLLGSMLLALYGTTPRVPELLAALFSSRGGLLYAGPVLWGAVFGLVRLAKRDPLLVVSAAALVVLGAAFPPGARRFAAALPLLGVGLGAGLAELRGLVARRPGIVPATLAAGLAVWNVLLMAQYRSGAIPRDEPVSFADVTRNSAALLSAAVGTPLAWPANWILAARDGVPIARYDAVFGRADVEATGGILRPGEDELPGQADSGWGGRRGAPLSGCWSLVDRARLFFSLESVRPLQVVVRAAGEGLLRLRANGRDISQWPLSTAGSDLTGRLLADEVRNGPNALELAVDPPARACVAEVRLARLP